MAAPIIGEASLTGERSDPHLNKTDFKTPNFSEDDLLIAQLAKTSHTQPQSRSAPVVKRRKSKPMRFDVSRTDAQKERLPPKINIVINEPLSPLSLQKEKSPSKSLIKAPVPNSPAMIRAVELRARLGNELPSCIKMMVRSQVTCGFWMGLPLSFCRSVLPKEEVTFILEDENGEQWDVKYIAYKSGLSAGWKTFAVSHNLIEGDVLVFQLVEYAKFKVYILRTDNSNEVDGALSLLNLDAHAEELIPDTPSPKTKKNKRQDSLSLTVVKKKQKKSTPKSAPVPQLTLEHSGNDSEEVGSEVLEGSRTSKTSFKEVKTFEDFHIMVKGLSIDRELPEDVKKDYYKLCFDKRQFLHENLPEGLYHKLVAGMIGETVNIANEIKSCTLTTTKEDYEVWDNSLKSFELLGMKVGFLRKKIQKLAKLAFKSESAPDIKKYVEAKNEKKRVENEIKKFEKKLLELKESAKKFEGISMNLKKKVEKYESKFQNEVNAPW